MQEELTMIMSQPEDANTSNVHAPLPVAVAQDNSSGDTTVVTAVVVSPPMSWSLVLFAFLYLAV